MTIECIWNFLKSDECSDPPASSYEINEKIMKILIDYRKLAKQIKFKNTQSKEEGRKEICKIMKKYFARFYLITDDPEIWFIGVNDVIFPETASKITPQDICNKIFAKTVGF